MLADVDLSPYVIHPISDEEIDALASALDRPLPTQIRELLRTIGCPQNFCRRLPDDERKLVEMQRGAGDGCFVFASDPNEDPIVCDATGRVFRLDPYDRRHESVAESVEAYVRLEAREPDPAPQAWHVQFTFQTNEVDEAMNALSEALGSKAETDWIHRDTSPAGVVTQCRRLSGPDGDYELSRLTYDGWESPTLALDYRFRPADIDRGRRIARRLEETPYGFALVNYGILPYDLGLER